MCKTILFIWTNQCQNVFNLLKEALMKSTPVVYPDLDKPYTLFTDTSKYAWSTVLRQEYTTSIDGKMVRHLT